MALATQCPHCHTTFKVAHDQLKLRTGLVRCGACKQIFNGIEHLVPPEQLAAAAPVSAPVKETPPPEASPTPPNYSMDRPASDSLTTQAAAEDDSDAAGMSAAHTSIDALEFEPIDDPETQTRILAHTPPVPMPGSPAGANHLDDDPLTRMTLVDFSAFDEDQTGQAEYQAADRGAPTQQDQPIQPNTANEFALAEPAALPDGDAAADPVRDDAQDNAAFADSVTHAPVQQPAEIKPADTPTAPFDGDSQEDLGAATPLNEAQTFNEPAAFEEAKDPEKSVEAEPLEDPKTSTEPPALEEAVEPEEAAEPEEADEPEFVTRDRRRQRTRAVLRIFMAVASVILLVTALAQGAYAFRNQLAAWFPQTKQPLAQFCALLGCQIKLPAQIDLVSLESSELQAVATDKNIFTLTLLLHNRSQVTQAWPHVELTLNDNNEKPLLRRVLTPREYLANEKDVAKGFAPQSELPVKVNFALQQVQASGYRVYLFYP
jgi:predicted Zn finger-like uncharacterized protein